MCIGHVYRCVLDMFRGRRMIESGRQVGVWTCVAVHVTTSVDLCIDECVGMCTNMCVDMYTDVHMDMCTDIGRHMRRDMQRGICIGMHIHGSITSSCRSVCACLGTCGCSNVWNVRACLHLWVRVCAYACVQCAHTRSACIWGHVYAHLWLCMLTSITWRGT